MHIPSKQPLNLHTRTTINHFRVAKLITLLALPLIFKATLQQSTAQDTRPGTAVAEIASEQPLETSPPREKPSSEVRDSAAGTDINAVAERIEAIRRQWRVPGLSVAIVHNDAVLLSQGFGLLEAGGDVAVDDQTLFAIASNTKAFTAAALAILVDRGEVQWDDAVSDYLPWFELSDPLATQELTVRDLLCHRSGLGTFSGDLLWWGTDYSPKEVLRRARWLEPASSFRSQYGYSNLMFLAAGQIVSKVSGKPWQQFVREEILQPIGMQRTIMSVDQLAQRGNFASPHKPDGNESHPIGWINWDTMAAAGGIISSAADMSMWLRLQLRGGQLADNQRLFAPERSREMWSAHTPIPISEGYSKRFPSTHFRAYGLGWSLSDYRGRKLVAHGGGYDGMYSQVVLVPEEQLGIVVLTNSMTSVTSAISYTLLDHFLASDDAGGVKTDWSQVNLELFETGRKKFQQRIADATTPAVAGTTPSHALDAYTGRFRCSLYGDATVELNDGQLVLRLQPNPDLVADLQHLHYDTFRIDWRKEFAWFAGGSCTFVADSRGVLQGIELDVPNEDLWFYELQLRRIE